MKSYSRAAPLSRFLVNMIAKVCRVVTAGSRAVSTRNPSVKSSVTTLKGLCHAAKYHSVTGASGVPPSEDGHGGGFH